MTPALRIFLLFLNAIVLAIMGGLAFLMHWRPIEFTFGFITAMVVFHLSYRAKHGEWFVD